MKIYGTRRVRGRAWIDDALPDREISRVETLNSTKSERYKVPNRGPLGSVTREVGIDKGGLLTHADYLKTRVRVKEDRQRRGGQVEKFRWPVSDLAGSLNAPMEKSVSQLDTKKKTRKVTTTLCTRV